MKKTIIAALLALSVSSGAFAAKGAWQNTHAIGKGQQHTSGVDITSTQPGMSVLLEGLAQTVPLTPVLEDLLWTTKEANVSSLAGLLVQGNPQGYRARRLAELEQSDTSAALTVAKLLRERTTDAAIYAWARREAQALYVQALFIPRYNNYATRTVRQRPVIMAEEYKLVALPLMYQYGNMANTVACAIHDALEIDKPYMDELAAAMAEAFFTADSSLFKLPAYNMAACLERETNCQPRTANIEKLSVAIEQEVFTLSAQGVAIQDNQGPLFDINTVCHQRWTITAKVGESRNRSVTDTSTSGNIVIRRDKLKLRAE